MFACLPSALGSCALFGICLEEKHLTSSFPGFLGTAPHGPFPVLTHFDLENWQRDSLQIESRPISCFRSSDRHGTQRRPRLGR